MVDIKYNQIVTRKRIYNISKINQQNTQTKTISEFNLYIFLKYVNIIGIYIYIHIIILFSTLDLYVTKYSLKKCKCCSNVNLKLIITDINTHKIDNVLYID